VTVGADTEPSDSIIYVLGIDEEGEETNGTISALPDCVRGTTTVSNVSVDYCETGTIVSTSVEAGFNFVGFGCTVSTSYSSTGKTLRGFFVTGATSSISTG
jgi:hypothetical protein